LFDFLYRKSKFGTKIIEYDNIDHLYSALMFMNAQMICFSPRASIDGFLINGKTTAASKKKTPACAGV
jgi:hypothetical protein